MYHMHIVKYFKNSSDFKTFHVENWRLIFVNNFKIHTHTK